MSKGLAKNDKFLDKWNSYYEKKSPVVRFIETINQYYFSKYFEKVFKLALGKRVRGLSILEPGCGSGIMSARLARQGANVYVLDISQNALNTAKWNFERFHTKPAGLVLGDITKMPLKTGSMDAVWNQGVIEHFKDRRPVVKEMFRLVKPGGKLILLVPGYMSPLHWVYMTLSALGLKNYWPFDDQDFLKKSQLRGDLQYVGAKNIRVKRLIGSFGLSLIGYGTKE